MSRRTDSSVRVERHTGLPVEIYQRASAEARTQKYADEGRRNFYFRKWSAVAKAVGVRSAVAYHESEIGTMYGGTPSWQQIRRWLLEWQREQRTGKAVV